VKGRKSDVFMKSRKSDIVDGHQEIGLNIGDIVDGHQGIRLNIGRLCLKPFLWLP
jgi:hypothetical protein